MSKKNNKGTKRRLHEHELKKEKEEQEKRQKVQERKEITKASTGGVQKAKAKKPFRLRKGVRVKGIKVVDSESKKKIRQLLKAEAAMKMDVDGGKPKAKKQGGMLKGVKGLGKNRKSKQSSSAAASKGKADQTHGSAPVSEGMVE